MEDLVSMGFSEEMATCALRQTRGNLEEALNLLLNGFDTSHADTVAAGGGAAKLVELDVSQYSFGSTSTSSCTSICCAISLTLLQLIETHAKSPIQTLHCLAELSEALFNGVTYQAMAEAQNPYQDGNHMSAEDIHGLLPEQLQAHMTLISSIPQQAVFTKDKKHFQNFFRSIRELGDAQRSVAVVITKPPESIVVVLPAKGEESSGYLLFDSHSRPHLGVDNAYLIHFATMDDLADRLNELFPALPSDSFGGDHGGSKDYLTSMYEQFEGTPFQLRSS
jgi:hypothetical protein